MCKSKVQPFISTVLGRLQIGMALLLRHGAPPAIAGGVAPHVVNLGSDDEDHVPRQDTEKDLVAAAVHWCVVGAVNLLQ